MSDVSTTPPHCPTCGNEGPLGGRSFCEVCGDFIDWDEAARSTAPPAPPPPAPAPPASAPSTPAQAPRSVPPRAPTQPAASSAQTGAAGAQRAADEAERQRRARALLVPLSEPEVAPVLPGRPEPPRPEVRSAVAAEESGIVCWNCGVGNRPDRRFCRNCGVDLSAGPAAAPPPRPSWWRRLLSWFARLGSGRLIALGVLLVLAALAVPAFLLVQRLLATEIVLPPAQVAASQADPVHPVANAFDGVQDSWWGTGRNGDSAGQFLQASFARPVDLEAITIVPGVSGRPADRDRQNRPQRIDITIQDVRGQVSVFNVQLQDGIGQRLPVRVDDVTQVTLTLRSAYIAGPDRQVAIAEVQFVGRSGG
jgi:hypothetical protein